MRLVCTALLVALFILVIQSPATTRKVPQDFTKIQLAINAAVNGDTVLVSEGTYIENIRITKKIVVASLFIADNNKSHITNTIINGSSPSHPDSGSAVTIEGDVDTTTIIKGFTITGGKGNKRYVSAENIYAMGGGGIELFSSGGARISYNIIKNNTVSNTGSVTNTWAGGIGVGSPTAPYISDYTIIEYNTISYNIVNGSYGEGGGILWMTNGRVTGNNISNNFAKNIGGGISVLGGCNIMMSQNYISQNIAGQNGGGFFIYYYTITSQQPTLTLLNNIIVKNTAQGGSVLRMNGGDLRMIQNTIADNSATTYSIHLGALGASSNTVQLLNNIIWNPLSANQIATNSVYSSNNCVYGGLAGTDNISTDPSFALFDTLYHLSNTSPAIGAGISSASLGSITLNAPAKDYSGSSRPNPSWSRPDIGAMESAQAFPGGNAIRVPQDQLTIQNGINAAQNGDVVLVSEGTYKENLVIAKKITLASMFYLDKDTSHISKTIIDGSTPTHPDSASVIRIFPGTDTTTVISGFTIRNGLGTKLDLPGSADWIAGGGIRVFGGGAKITHNIISGNTMNSSLGVYGGGIVIEPLLGPINYWIIEHNRISNNTIQTTGTSGVSAEGGGVWLTEDGRFAHNVVMGNTASASVRRSFAGGISIVGYTAYDTSNILLFNNLIQGNQALVGGGFGMYSDPSGTARPNVVLYNNLIVGNTTTDFGSAIDVNSGDYTLINNTITGNYGDTAISLGQGRGALNFRMLNNILWNQAALKEINFPARAAGSYNLVRGGFAGTNNISVDPIFAANDSFYRLSNASPCIGAGIASSSVGGVTLNAPLFDHFNTQRPRESGTNPDMGAVENDRSSPTSVKEIDGTIPTSFALEQNYPNPFNPSTTIRYALPISGNVILAVYDLLGREIATLVSEEQSAGWKEVEWNAKDLSSGIYFYTITAGTFVETKKMLVVK